MFISCHYSFCFAFHSLKTLDHLYSRQQAYNHDHINETQDFCLVHTGCTLLSRSSRFDKALPIKTLYQSASSSPHSKYNVRD